MSVLFRTGSGGNNIKVIGDVLKIKNLAIFKNRKNISYYYCGFKPTLILQYNQRVPSGIGMGLYSLKNGINEAYIYHTSLDGKKTFTVDGEGFSTPYPPGGDNGGGGYFIAIEEE